MCVFMPVHLAVGTTIAAAIPVAPLLCGTGAAGGKDAPASDGLSESGGAVMTAARAEPPPGIRQERRGGKEGRDGEQEQAGEWHLLSVCFFPPCSCHHTAVGNGVLPSGLLRKEMVGHKTAALAACISRQPQPGQMQCASTAPAFSLTTRGEALL